MNFTQTRALRLLGLLSLGLFSTLASAQQVVIVEPVVLTPTQPTGRFIGSLRARSTSVMAALEEGALIELNVREADTVRKGDVLASVDSRRLQMSLTQVRADMAMGRATALEREASLTNAAVDLEALERAAQSGAVSERDLRNARTAVTVARAMLEAAQQSVVSLEAKADLLQLRIDDATVRAPFDGSVVAKHAEIGQWIRPGDPLVTLVSTGALEAWVQVPESHMGDIDFHSDSIPLLLEGTGAKTSGVNARTIPMVDDRARTFTLILDVLPGDSTEGAFRAGMSVSATVSLGQNTPRLVLGSDAILRRGTNSLVAKIGPENIAELVPVRVLFPTGTGFAVEPLVPGALKPGDRVVTEGNERLYPGTPVKPTVRSTDAPIDPAVSSDKTTDKVSQDNTPERNAPAAETQSTPAGE